MSGFEEPHPAGLGGRPDGCAHALSSGHPARPLPEGSDGERAGGHGHDHGLEGHATGTGKHRRKLVLVLCITAAVFLAQVFGAWISHSLSLLADAGHMLTDATGVLIALIASVLAARPANSKRTFGLMRVEVLAALANGVILSVIAVVIFVEAIRRFGTEVEVESGPMLVAAIVGGLANLASLLILRSGREESLNIRGAYLEVLGDLLGSLAVVIAGIVILLTGWNVADQIASIVIALMIAPRAYSLLRDVLRVLLEASPEDIDVDETRRHMLTVPGVRDVHDLHAWTITSGVNAISAHVVVDEGHLEARGYHGILDELNTCLGEHFDTDHTTLQLEPVPHADHETHLHA